LLTGVWLMCHIVPTGTCCGAERVDGGGRGLTGTDRADGADGTDGADGACGPVGR